MSRYNVLLYDKDNDIYETVTSTDNRGLAQVIAESFNKFVHQDRIINVGYDYNEPFDAVYIEDTMYKEDNLTYVEYK